MRGHEIDNIRGRELCRYDKIPFIFAVFVVDKNEHATARASAMISAVEEIAPFSSASTWPGFS
jgi:predicted solute-binding protein